jgi:hypothetical protein
MRGRSGCPYWGGWNRVALPTYCEEVKVGSYVIFPFPEIKILSFQAAHEKHIRTIRRL